MTAVPPKLIGIWNIFDMISGNIANIASENPPTNVNLETTLFKYSDVGLPGLIPGMKPPFCCRLLAYSTVLNWIAV